MPVRPCTELTSSASSIFNLSLIKRIPKYEANPNTIPKKNELCAVMKPAAGVTPARPQIAPLIAAVVDGFFDLFHDSKIQTTADVTAPIWVTRNAFAAKAPDASALPALKPNQPNQSKDAPRTARGILCGTIISGPKFFRRPKTSAAAIEAKPADV